ncbi:MAG: ACT domain-containing protein [Acidimicrobiia bacterium]|nr:ACT domain-containing protein [Acidimicrobiia bacterium]
MFLEGDTAGELMFYGRGAGGEPTASAVLGDVIDAASNLRRGGGAGFGHLVPARLRPMDDLVSEYYLTVQVADRHGVLARVAGVFGDHGVSIRSMEQEGLGADRAVSRLHHPRGREARPAGHRARALSSSTWSSSIGSLLRVVGERTEPGRSEAASTPATRTASSTPHAVRRRCWTSADVLLAGARRRRWALRARRWPDAGGRSCGPGAAARTSALATEVMWPYVDGSF